jgi:hypothetical protein
MEEFKKSNSIMDGKGEWDESKHPRDDDGKFTKKLTKTGSSEIKKMDIKKVEANNYETIQEEEKNKIAEDINYIAPDIARIIAVDSDLSLKEGELYDNRGKAESWSCGSEMDFEPESTGNIKYVFYARNVPVHKVDYNNETEVEVLGAVDDEGEVLVPKNAVFKIKYAPENIKDHIDDMGYVSIDLEFLGFKDKYGKIKQYEKNKGTI